MVKEIYFAGGCFWGVEKYFAYIAGVTGTQAGYANGNTENPSYEDVCHKDTGHAETVKVLYDGDKVDLLFLLDMFYKVIDPASVNRQGNDAGVQYRTGVYFTNPVDERVILDSIVTLQEGYDEPVAIEVQRLDNFYPAEQHHQKYLDKNPGGYCHIPAEKFESAKEAKKNAPKGGDELKEKLTELQYQVTQNGATEPAFKNKYYDNFKSGVYVDIVTNEPLFVSTDKFESGCGWPAFSRPISKSLLDELPDFSYNRERVEVRSKNGGAHLGHVFEDGPEELGGMRYCINSAALRFIPKEDMEKEGFGAYIGLVK